MERILRDDENRAEDVVVILDSGTYGDGGKFIKGFMHGWSADVYRIMVEKWFMAENGVWSGGIYRGKCVIRLCRKWV